jgi:hypothetical protein
MAYYTCNKGQAYPEIIDGTHLLCDLVKIGLAKNKPEQPKTDAKENKVL